MCKPKMENIYAKNKSENIKASVIEILLRAFTKIFIVGQEFLFSQRFLFEPKCLNKDLSSCLLFFYVIIFVIF